MSQIRVLLADDHEVVRAGFQRLLESKSDIRVIAQAASGEEAYQAYVEHRPDVVVMDLTMSGMGGLETSRRILAKDEEARILIFSVHENEILLARALELGVHGYISKRSASRVMTEAVRFVAAGEMYIGQEMMPFLVKRRTDADSQLVASLTKREFEVLQHLVDSKSVNEIAALLHLSPKTVGHHVTRIKAKLNLPDIAALTRFAIRVGLITP